MVKKYFLKSAIVAAFLATAANVNAQIVSCNAFLKGNYIELGVSPMGSFGSSVTQPAGYHGNFTTASVAYNPCAGITSGNFLGFIADPDMDGWAVGTPPFWGDYFLPGSPYEGFTIQVNGSRADAFNTNTGFTGTLTGTNVSDTTIGGTTTAVWQGMFDSLMIKQVVTLDTGNLYFKVDVTLINLSSVAKNNIYYMRSIDPDNDEMEAGGGFPTNNYVMAQHPDTSFGLVVATGVTHPTAYLGLGSTDTNSRVFTFVSWPLPATTDVATVYDETISTGTYSFAMGDSSINMDIAIGIVFNIPHLAALDSASDSVYNKTTTSGLHPANSRTMSYFYSFSKAATDSAIHSNTSIHPTSIKDINQSDVRVYPNPAKNEINVTGLATTDRIMLLNMIGNVAINDWSVTNNGINNFKMSHIPAGHYLLVIVDEQGNVRSRIPVQKN